MARCYASALALATLFIVLPVEAQTLRSDLFRDDPQLNAAAVSPSAHIAPGTNGAHVGKLQRALIETDAAEIDAEEMRTQRYGPSTANAVLNYKQKRDIVNRAYQSTADNIVGVMTVTSLDTEMRFHERRRLSPDEIRSLMGPPLVEPVPGFDAVAPDGFVIPIPRALRTRHGTQLLDHATVNVIVSGRGYVLVVDNTVSSESHPNAQAAAKATAQTVAARATNQALRYKPVPGRVISFGVGRIAGGFVSVVGAILEPSPFLKETYWIAEISGKPVQYVVLH